MEHVVEGLFIAIYTTTEFCPLWMIRVGVSRVHHTQTAILLFKTRVNLQVSSGR